jgi:hypothetical protein
MVAIGRLTAAEREQLSDARLLLEAAAHAARQIELAKGELGDEARQSLDNACNQAAQAAAGLKRLKAGLAKKG